MTPKIAAIRRAFGVSLTVSWYSGANVAQHSMPYDDQHIAYSQTITSVALLTPSECALAAMLLCRLLLCQSPVK